MRERVRANNPTVIVHGQYGKPIYHVWRSMLQRCYSPKVAGFHRYGGRGIKVCKRWHTFVNFYADMGDRPSGMTLERVNNEVGYRPDNCIWATQAVNNNNRSTCVLISHRGATLTAKQWSEKTGIPDCTILKRLRKGWPMRHVFSTERFHRWNRP